MLFFLAIVTVVAASTIIDSIEAAIAHLSVHPSASSPRQSSLMNVSAFAVAIAVLVICRLLLFAITLPFPRAPEAI